MKADLLLSNTNSRYKIFIFLNYESQNLKIKTKATKPKPSSTLLKTSKLFVPPLMLDPIA